MERAQFAIRQSGKKKKMMMIKYLLVFLAGLALVQGYCYRKNPPRSQENAEQLQQPANYSILVCIRSDSIEVDLEKVPKINTTQILYSMSNIPKIKSSTFVKFEKLIKIEMYNSKIAEIEDNAFSGKKKFFT